jgi:FAD/FMN-containing dehydrogenase
MTLVNANLFADILPPERLLTNADAIALYSKEQRGTYVSEPSLVLLPSSTAEVAAIVTRCAANKIPLVPQGGNTGLVGGAVCAPGEVLLNFSRMNKIQSLRPDAFAMTVEAGCTLRQVQDAASAEQLYFPLGLSTADTCQIGGNISSNAGGINVLRYGMTRNLVLGLEAVLADGTIWSDASPTRKKNEGVDLKQLLIGSEGTIAFITSATLALQTKPQQSATLLIVSEQIDELLSLYKRLQQESNHTLTAFEFITAPCWHLLEQTRPELMAQLDSPKKLAALARLESSSSAALFNLDNFAANLAAALNIEHLNEQRAALFWQARRELPWAQRDYSPSIKHDIAVPLDRIQEFLKRAGQKIHALYPDALLISFGHLGDGNIHYNISVTDLTRKNEVNECVFTLARDCGGSISAEHGLGLARLEDYAQTTDKTTQRLQRQLKQLFDPHNILNPGKSAGAQK